MKNTTVITSSDERAFLQIGPGNDVSTRPIARRLGRRALTLSREGMR